MNKDGDNISNESQRNAPWLYLILGLFMYLLAKHLFVFTSTFEVSVAFHHPTILSFSHLHLLTPSLSVCVVMEMLQTSWGISK